MKTEAEVEAMIRHSQKIIEDELTAMLKGAPSTEMLSRANRYIAELQAQQAAYYWVLENEKALTCNNVIDEGEDGHRKCMQSLGHTGQCGDKS